MADFTDFDSSSTRAALAGYFGFRRQPFQHGDLEAFYDNPRYERARSSLLEGIRQGAGVLVLIGKSGTGKTLLLRKLMQDAPAQFRFIFCYTANLGFDDLLTFVCDRLGLQARAPDRASQLVALGEYLHACKEQQTTVALILDEAHKLPETTLEELLRLVQRTGEEGDALPMVLSGSPSLEQGLERHRASFPLLDEAPRVCLQALNAEETSAFVDRQLQLVGGRSEELFPPPVLECIAKAAQGIPRRIHSLCDQALHLAYQKGEKQVTLETIEEVVGARDIPESTEGVGPATTPVHDLAPTVPNNKIAGGKSAPPPATRKPESPVRWAALLVCMGVLAGSVIGYLLYESSRKRENNAVSVVADSQPAEVADVAPAAADHMSRGDEAFERGDVDAARGFYQTAADLGQASAMTALAKAYDPVELQRRSLDEVQADPLRAARWYVKARDMGDPDAVKGLDGLRLWLEQNPNLDMSGRDILQTLLQSEDSSSSNPP